MNLQTLSFVAHMESLFTNHREPLNDLETQLLADYESIKASIHETYSDEYIATALERSDGSLEERKELAKSLDISFHRHFKRLHDSFRGVREYYTEISPDIDAIFVNSVSSVMSLVDLYSTKSEMFRRGRRDVPKQE